MIKKIVIGSLVAVISASLGFFIASTFRSDNTPGSNQKTLVLGSVNSDVHLKGKVFIIGKDGQAHNFSNVKVSIVSAGDNNKGAILISTKTNKDGEFEDGLQFGKYEISVSAQENVGGAVETYEWKVPVDLQEKNATIVLNNDNLIKKS